MMVRFAIAAGTYLISFVFWLSEWYYMLIFATSILLSQEDIRKAHQSTPRERPSYWRPHEEQRTRLGSRAEPCVGVQSFCQEFRTRIQWAKNAVSSEEKIFEKISAFIDQLENETAEHGIPEVGGLSSFLRLSMDNIKNVEDVTMKAQASDNLRALSTLFPYMSGLVRFKQETKTQLISKLSDSRVTHHEHGELQGHQVIQSANDSRLYPFWYNAQTNSRKLSISLNTTFASFGSTYKTPHLIRKSVKSLYTFAHCLLYSHRSSQMSRAICDDKLFDVNMIQYIWCSPDNIIPMKWMQRYTLPSVAISQQFDIPSRANGPLKGANVKARLISSKAIPGFVYPFQNLQREVSGREMPLIMHMHGGGFISGSTNMHENYLREWAIITGYPIVSIDYSSAPQQKYPTQLNECFEAYRWSRKTNCLGFKISELIVVGDSAGGNSATAMCYKCTTEDIIAPDASVLHYPALDLSNTPHASRVLFMDDPVVPFPAVTKCRDAYSGPTEESDSDLYLDPFVSPSFGTDKMIEGLPNSVHIYAAEYDPLADEAIHFAERSMNAKKEVHFGCHQNMPHGYLTSARYTPDAVKLVQDHGHMLAEIVQSLRKKAQTAS